MNEPTELAEAAKRKSAKVEEQTGEKTLKMDDRKVCRVPLKTMSDSADAETSTFFKYFALCTFSQTFELELFFLFSEIKLNDQNSIE